MNHHVDSLSIGAFAEVSGVGVETVRFYQRKGLLPEPQRLQGRIRRYGENDLGRMRFIRYAQRLGFSLDEIAGLLRLDDKTDCAQARELAERKLVDVRAELAELRQLESILEHLVQACHSSANEKSCALIAELHACQCVQRC
ncbi:MULTISPECIES: MerR family transcriptional regulator [unclassified Variovorax]|uniref:MerR family transcriptional regulator n=1 Tax=unclassified Variovorax TaxID=663243 RepID=UPI003F44F58C